MARQPPLAHVKQVSTVGDQSLGAEMLHWDNSVDDVRTHISSQLGRSDQPENGESLCYLRDSALMGYTAQASRILYCLHRSHGCPRPGGGSTVSLRLDPHLGACSTRGS